MNEPIKHLEDCASVTHNMECDCRLPDGWTICRTCGGEGCAICNQSGFRRSWDDIHRPRFAKLPHEKLNCSECGQKATFSQIVNSWCPYGFCSDACYNKSWERITIDKDLHDPYEPVYQDPMREG